MQRWQVYLQQFMPDLRVVKSPALKSYIGLITFSAASLAIALGITLSKILVFEYHSNSGVVGWLSVNEYPKQQEYFFYLLALLGVPITICLYWLGWCVYSRWCAERTAQPIQRVLKANALASIPLWLCWLQVYHIGQSVLIGLLLPIGLSILIKLALLYLRYFPTLWNSDVSGDTGTGEVKNLASENGGNLTDETDGVSAPVSYRTTQIWRGGLEYIILPIFIYLLTYSASIHGNIDLFHEGERLAPLNEMLRGGVPFRDIYIQHGLFQNAYLAWVGSQLFEPTLFGVRSMEDILAPLGYVALYVLGLQVFRSRFLVAFLCVVIASGTQFWVSPRHSLGLISFAFVANSLTHFQETRTNKVPTYVWKLLLAGLSTSLAFWYSTEVGLYTLGAIGLFLVMYVLQGGFGTEIRGGRGYKPRQQAVRGTEYLLPPNQLWLRGAGRLSLGRHLFLVPWCFGRCHLEFLYPVPISTRNMGTRFSIPIKNACPIANRRVACFHLQRRVSVVSADLYLSDCRCLLDLPGTIRHAFSQHDETSSLTPRRHRILPDSTGPFRWRTSDLRCDLFMAPLLVSVRRWYFQVVSCFKRRETLAARAEGGMGADPDSDILLVRWGSASTVGGLQWEMATLASESVQAKHRSAGISARWKGRHSR